MRVRMLQMSAAILLLLIAAPFTAARATDGPLPDIPGSWRDSCQGGSIDGMTLTSNCRAIDGREVATSLDLTTCGQPPSAGNQDGTLVCESGPRNPPVAGSWAQSCGYERLTGTLLAATCRNVSGEWVVTSLDVESCNAPATAGNQDGTLVCESGVKPPPIVTADPPPAPAEPQTPPVAMSEPAKKPPVILSPEPVPPASGEAPPGATAMTFAGNWTIVTERGDSFALDMTQTGNAASGSVVLDGKPLQMNGSVIGADKISLVWQYQSLAGTGEFVLGANRQEFDGKLLMGDGTPIQGGIWKATRENTGPALPFGEVKETAALPQGATAAPAAGYERAVSTTELAIRDKPTSKGSKILGSLKTGEVVSVRCPPDNAYWCQLQDGRGWVSRQYINIGPTATATPPPTTTKKVSTSTKKSTTAKKPDPKKDESNFIQGLGAGFGVIFGN